MAMPIEPELLPLAVPPPVVSQVGILVQQVGANYVSVKYVTLPGNTPKTNANFLAIWESTIVPWPVTPLATQKINLDSQDGSVVFQNLQIQSKPYIVGYAVGPKITNICATATIFVGGQVNAADNFSTNIGLAVQTPDTLVVQYTCAAGYQPQAAGNWIGLWQGDASPYYSGPPLNRTSVTSNSSQSTVVMNGLSLTIQTQYTLAYFVGPDATNAAAILTFTTP
jgi:hypothetical protein